MLRPLHLHLLGHILKHIKINQGELSSVVGSSLCEPEGNVKLPTGIYIYIYIYICTIIIIIIIIYTLFNEDAYLTIINLS